MQDSDQTPPTPADETPEGPSVEIIERLASALQADTATPETEIVFDPDAVDAPPLVGRRRTSGAA